jgi:hypothetical protein
MDMKIICFTTDVPTAQPSTIQGMTIIILSLIVVLLGSM